MTLSTTALAARVAASIGAARAALRGSNGGGVQPLIVRRRGGAAPVAFLAALGDEGDCCAVVPLISGRSIVGRERVTAQYDWAACPVLVEAGQWVLRCNEDRSAEVADAWSTNGSILFPAAALTEWPEGAALPRLPQLTGHPAAVPLVHPAYNEQKLAYRAVAEGDLLIGIYRTFVFGWM